ncbi:hypothetical protein GF389_02645 [Candidatus Dojkabacteria bacterium]|nr:hypothetical protein [Candidatus Dojkabacteria bacterium]
MSPQVKELKKKLQDQGLRGLALDIDETLSYTTKWWFSAMSEKFGNPENLTAEEIYEKYRHSSKIPYWQTEEARIWMEERRYDDSIQIEFELIEEEVNSLVRQVHSTIPVVAYITARPQEVRKGTLKWLEKHDFPKAELIQRPNESKAEDGNKWKAEILEYLYPEVIGIVDDNVDFPSHISPNYQGTIFLYNYETDPTDGMIEVVPCKTWNNVLEKINDRYKNN